jgi:hypothetical protein
VSSDISLPMPIGPWADWRSVILTIDQLLIRWVEEGTTLPVTVTAVQNSNNKELLSFTISAGACSPVPTALPQYPLTVTILDSGKGEAQRQARLVFPKR